ncbi:hypothetical protein RhiirA1_479082 [Rhizophagus irregularis]|uniref:Uncharacterized protein n=1 Tax=Rhizophagus irregularis TaxID=588596 RepID=A0A2N0QR64_9GLOM|nr:hypothetical protein RhiirA1_479082 [Rhizophagus irregularis]GET53891.1 hypothetical protein RIR_e49716_A0A2N0QR64_9GLOM [Rhizophagus irregularis DAOM 181602=DAOM 197198]
MIPLDYVIRLYNYKIPSDYRLPPDYRLLLDHRLPYNLDKRLAILLGNSTCQYYITVEEELLNE